MNKSELIAAMAAKAELSKKDTEKALAAFEAVVTETLAQNEAVQLTGFGTFRTSERKERVGRNPKTGEEIHIPSRVLPTFKVGKILKEAIQ